VRSSQPPQQQQQEQQQQQPRLSPAVATPTLTRTATLLHLARRIPLYHFWT
jgi:hypothetical protein